MADLIIHGHLAERLRQAARQSNQSVEKLLETLLTGVTPLPSRSADIQSPPGTLAALAEAADKADLHLGDHDVATRSREILDDEWGQHLTRWKNTKSDDSDA
jgi:hypothetical protein